MTAAPSQEDLGWTEVPPNFKCPKGHSTGARCVNGVWSPLECYLCDRARKQQEAAARRKLGDVAAGVDVRRAFEAYRKLVPFKGRVYKHLKLKVTHKAEGSYSGRAWQKRILVSYGPEVTPAQVLEVLVHEMCHAVCPARTGHGERYRLTLKRAALELWGIDLPLLKGSERGARTNAAYTMDDILMKLLDERIAAGSVELFPPAPAAEAAPALSRAERNVRLVEKRAAHVTKMLERAERRAAAALKLRAKWRAKARYYERVAAKRGAGT